MTDEQLVQLAWHYRSQLLDAIFRRLNNWHDAEDAYQDTLLRVAKTTTFQGGRQPLPWIRAVAARCAIDRHHRDRKHRLHSSGSCFSYLVDKQPGPDVIAQQNEDAARLYQAIDLLGPKTREAIILVHFRGLQYEQAARALKCPYWTFKNRVSRGHKRLRALLQ